MAVEQTFKRKNTYIDFDFSLTSNPLTKDIGVKKDANAIKQSVKNLIQTGFGERPFHPEIGSNVRGLLFEPADPITTITLRNAIEETINNFEPRVALIDVFVGDLTDRNAYEVKIIYNITGSNEVEEQNITLERLR